MKTGKQLAVFLLLTINIFMLVIPVIPHHHHTNNTICFKHDISTHEGCPIHHHHNNGDPCCDSNCMTRWDSSIPSFQVEHSPNFVFIAVLFSDQIIKDLFKPQEQRLNNHTVFRESLHGINLPSTFSLRAPPTFPRV